MKPKEYRSINVCIGEESKADLELFGLLPLINEWEEFYFFEDIKHMSNLMKEIDIFKSTSEARNNRFDYNIPKGYTEIKMKNYRNIYILDTRGLKNE